MLRWRHEHSLNLQNQRDHFIEEQLKNNDVVSDVIEPCLPIVGPQRTAFYIADSIKGTCR